MRLRWVSWIAGFVLFFPLVAGAADLTISAAVSLKDAFAEIAKAYESVNSPEKVLLNFGNVEFMSSAALGKLITLHRKLQAVQGKLVLCKIAKDILDVFKITKLDKILSITTDEQAGLQSFS